MNSSKYKIKKSLAAVLWLTIFVVSSFAVTVTEYKKNVAIAISELDNIYYIKEDYETEDEQNAEVKKSIRNIQNGFLKSEKIEIDGFFVEPDNVWLNETLLEIESKKLDDETREKLLNDAIEKLTSLELKLDEVEKQIRADRTKNQDKQKLQEILSRNDYQKAVKKEEKEKSWLENVLDDLKNALLEWLKSIFPENSGIQTPSSDALGSLSLVLQFLIVAAALAIVGFVLYRFAPFLFGIKRKEKKERKTRVILGETILADQDATDILSDADLLARNGDMRGAIRKGYIALLCELSDRKVIGLAQHKTNRDYLRDVRKNQPLHQNMNILTNSFERHWYGFSNADEKDWQEFREKYSQALSNRN